MRRGPARSRRDARVERRSLPPTSSTGSLPEQNQELHRNLDGMLAERDEYNQAADALARAINVLTAENEELRRRASWNCRPMAPFPAEVPSMTKPCRFPDCLV
jgi:hypothetical protein